MNQDERNEQEWKNPKNWSGGIFGIYRSEKDTRVWMPKKNPKTGWTFNFAKRASFYWLFGTLLFIVLFIVVILLIVFVMEY